MVDGEGRSEGGEKTRGRTKSSLKWRDELTTTSEIMRKNKNERTVFNSENVREVHIAD
jgi:hypothetical protein